MMLEGIGHEALDRISVDSESPDEQGRKLVYCSPKLVVGLAKTQPYAPSVSEDMTSEECLEVDAPVRGNAHCMPCASASRRFELLIERSYEYPTARNGQGPSEKPDRTTRLGHSFVCFELVWAI